MKKTDWLILGLVGILILIIAIPTGSKKESSEETTDDTKSAAEMELAIEENQAYIKQSSQSDSYCEQLETELEELLEKVSGVGKVQVMITLKNTGEDILDKDIDSSENGYSSSTVVYEVDDQKVPYVTSQELPQIQGVVVVAQGGGDAVTVSKISEVIMALFGIEAHKITVVKMTVSEGSM